VAPVGAAGALVISTALAAAEGSDTPGVEGEAQGGPEIVEREFVEPLSEPLAVIPPGHEDLLADMLGRGVTLPGECKFANGQIERDTVIASYACPTGALVVALRHPDKAPEGATFTRQFALGVQSGSPPAGFVDALKARIGDREREFEWTWLGTSPRRQVLPIVALAAALVLVGGATWLLLRRRQVKRA
jgi:hypothetical protein